MTDEKRPNDLGEPTPLSHEREGFKRTLLARLVRPANANTPAASTEFVRSEGRDHSTIEIVRIFGGKTSLVKLWVGEAEMLARVLPQFIERARRQSVDRPLGRQQQRAAEAPPPARGVPRGRVAP